MSVCWDYYDKFEKINEKYLPVRGEGETKATQIVTAVNKLVYKWYNDGDVYDNTYLLDGWWNDLSSYANWLDENVPFVSRILHGISGCKNHSDYEDLLKDLTDKLLDKDFLAEQDKLEKIGTIYKCDGSFEFREYEEDDDYYDDDDDDWYEDDDWEDQV